MVLPQGARVHVPLSSWCLSSSRRALSSLPMALAVGLGIALPGPEAQSRWCGSGPTAGQFPLGLAPHQVLRTQHHTTEART